MADSWDVILHLQGSKEGRDRGRGEDLPDTIIRLSLPRKLMQCRENSKGYKHVVRYVWFSDQRSYAVEVRMLPHYDLRLRQEELGYYSVVVTNILLVQGS